MIRVIADGSDPMIVGKADEYCDLMLKIAVAIEEQDEVQLNSLVNELERKPGL